jgi:small conductance mechanosensitive channel
MCCGIIAQPAVISPAMELPLALPGPPKPPANAPTHSSGATEGTNEALAALKAKLQTATEALETLKKELAPRLAEADNTIQYVSTALEKALDPQETKRLEEELRLAGEWQTLLQGELAVAEEEVQVAEGLLQMPQKRELLAVEKSQFEAELQSRSFASQDAKMATTEARVATEKAALARGKAEMFQDELLSLEKEVAGLKFEASKMAQELADLQEKKATPEASQAETSQPYELRLARRRAEIALKKVEIAQKRFDVMQGKYALARQEKDLFALQSEAMEERAKSIRATVGLSLDDVRAEEGQAAAAQQAAQTEKQKAQQEQVKAQEEREKAQQALQLARTAKQQATTDAQLRVADIRQSVAERQAELAQRKADLAKERVEVAGVAAEIAQRRLGLTTRKLEVERGALTATEILSNYEVARGEAARAVKTAQSAQANAELARRELEAFKREAELAELKVQAERSQPGYQTGDAVARDTAAALDEGARVAAERSQVAEEWAALLQERARLAAERAQISTDLEQLLGQHRATYQLWKREPSKITWNAFEEVYTDLVILRSMVILGVSTLPAQIGALLDSLLHPSRYWRLLQHVIGAVLCFMLAAFAALFVRRRLQPVIDQQAQWFLPPPRKKLLRAATRLLQAIVLPAFLLLAAMLIFQFVTLGKALFGAIVVTLAGLTAYRFLTSVVQELFMPWDPHQRLINCREGIAAYLYRHLHRIILYISIFLTLIYILEAFNYHEGLIALLRLICDIGLLVLFILLAYNKEAIVSLLPSAENRLEKSIYVTVTRIYPLLVLFLICIVALSNLGYVNLARFLASSCALTVVILITAHFASKGLGRVLHWALMPRNRVETDFAFSRETRETMYLIFTHGLTYLVHLAAIIVIAGVWGVDLSGVYATLTSERARDYYQRLGAVVLIIGFSVAFLRSTGYLIDKVFNLSAAEARAWRRRIALGDKGPTIAPLLKSLLKYSTIFVAAVLVLRALGVDPTPIIAGAGVIGLAVGFGAQTLVKDVISGFFLLFEGVIAVGDVITFGNSTGVVEEVGLRVTKYRTFSGELWVIPNGEIRAFGNHNRQWMRAIVTVGVAYEQDVVKAMHILEEVGKSWAMENQGIVLEAPAVQGILSFDDSAMSLRLVVKVRPGQQGTAEWELRRRIKEAFDREGVEVPFLRRVFITRQEPNGVTGEEQPFGPLPQRVQKVEGPAEAADSDLKRA